MRLRHARAVLLAAALAVLAAGAPGTAGPAPVRAKHGTLTADTTIRWHGNAGIRLAAAGGTLSKESMSLYLTGGTFAFVTIFDDPRECRTRTTRYHCRAFTLMKFPGSDEFPMQDGPGRGHFAMVPDPPTVVGRHLDVYLFTDGEATLRLRPGGYRGRSSYVASGKVRGLARRLPGSCADLCERTPATEAAAGGAAYDFGNRPGHLVTVAFSHTPGDVDHLPSNHPMAVRSCVYPSIFQPDASPSPADHPHGCDAVPRDTGDAATVATEGANSVSVTMSGWARSWYVSDRRGRLYAGFSAARAWVERGYTHGHAVWFNYGIT